MSQSQEVRVRSLDVGEIPTASHVYPAEEYRGEVLERGCAGKAGAEG